MAMRESQWTNDILHWFMCLFFSLKFVYSIENVHFEFFAHHCNKILRCKYPLFVCCWRFSFCGCIVGTVYMCWLPVVATNEPLRSSRWTLNWRISFTRISFTMLTCWLCQRQASILFTDNKLNTRHQNDGHNGKKDHVKDKRKIVLVHHVRLRFTKITNTQFSLWHV